MKKRLDLIAIALTVAVMSLLVAIPVFGHAASGDPTIRIVEVGSHVSATEPGDALDYVSNYATTSLDQFDIVIHDEDIGTASISVDIAVGRDDYTVVLHETGNAGEYIAEFRVTLDDGEAGLLQEDVLTDAGIGGDYLIFAEHEDVIEFTYGVTTGFGYDIDDSVIVDGEGPDVSSISPAAEVFSGNLQINFDINVEDDGIGMGDEDDVEGLVDFFVSTNANGTGAINAGPPTANEQGDGSFRVIRSISPSSADVYYWWIEAVDELGNVTRVPADDADDLFFIYNIDDEQPELVDAWAGIGWDSGDETTVPNRRAIMLEFAGDDGGPEVLNPDTVDTDDFEVDGNEPVSIVMANVASATFDTGDGVETEVDARAFVWLILGSDMDSDETPEVFVKFAGFEDRAGNSNLSDVVDAQDRMGPAYETTITGENDEGRPVTRGTSTTPIEVHILSDEDLDGDPDIWYASFAHDDNGTPNDTDDDTVTLINRTQATGIEDLDDDEFVDEQTRGSLCQTIGNACLVGVFIFGVDGSGNEAITPGLEDENDMLPENGDVADLSALQAAGLLFEFDDHIQNPPVVRLSPSANAPDNDETESPNPFIIIEFDEAMEFPLNAVDSFDGVEIDASNVITITSMELDGDEIDVDTLGVSQAGSWFTLATSGLEVGDHELVFTAEDAAGNEVEEEFPFKVLERGDYEIDLSPGWNLMSFPSTPSNSDIDEVFPEDHPASSILSYQDGQWLIAARGAGGEWEGSLASVGIMGTAAYWVQTDRFTPVSTPIEPLDPAGGLPEIPVRAGWNLVPVVDLSLAEQDEFPGGAGTVTVLDYFASINWSVAYRYNTTSGGWVRITPSTTGTDAEVRNGMAFWVWATRDGALAP